MSGDRPVGETTLVALAAAAVGVCCGLPVLLSVGAGIAIAGLGLRSWLFAGAGLLAVIVAGVRLRHQRRGLLLRKAKDWTLVVVRRRGRAQSQADSDGAQQSRSGDKESACSEQREVKAAGGEGRGRPGGKDLRA